MSAFFSEYQQTNGTEEYSTEINYQNPKGMGSYDYFQMNNILISEK